MASLQAAVQAERDAAARIDADREEMGRRMVDNVAMLDVFRRERDEIADKHAAIEKSYNKVGVLPPAQPLLSRPYLVFFYPYLVPISPYLVPI